MKLVVISHTGHCRDLNGEIVGWSPTVREIEKMSKAFEHVWHLAFLHQGSPPKTYSPYDSSNVTFVPLRVAGGHSLSEKLKVLYYAWSNLKIIKKCIDQADAVQLRLPTGIGVYVLPWLSWFVKRSFILWVKYAGNWAHLNPPLTYRFQRWFLMRNFQRSIVTINGRWPGQPTHCLTFENPCLTDQEIQEGINAAHRKDFTSKLRLLFVGRIEKAKGVDKIIEMMFHLASVYSIEDITFVGEGDIDSYSRKCKGSPIKYAFVKGTTRRELNDFYGRSHLLILPSESEGFPKVVAEASAYGCIPVVSDVSSLSQYINASNGHVFKQLEPSFMAKELQELIEDRDALKIKALNALSASKSFSYTYYIDRIYNEILESR